MNTLEAMQDFFKGAIALDILREILRRMNSATDEPAACRLDPDLMEQIKKLFEDEK